jgi:hypothetical protein
LLIGILCSIEGKEEWAMKKTTLFLALALIFGLTFYTAQAEAQMGPGMMGPHMRGRGGMDPGMMGPGYGPGYDPGYGPQYGPQYQQPQKPMDEKDAKAIVEDYLASMRNPNLKLGKIEDKGNAFEAEVLTKDNSLVDKILVDKYTGWMRSVY